MNYRNKEEIEEILNELRKYSYFVHFNRVPHVTRQKQVIFLSIPGKSKNATAN